HALRRTLEPTLRLGGASTLIVTDGEAYRLALSAQDHCDAHELLQLVRSGWGREDPSDRLERLLVAEASYRGPFLAEWPYEDWAVAPRAEVERAYTTIVEELATRVLQAGDLR